MKKPVSDKSKKALNPTEFTLPKIGESITEATIIQWHFEEGETFQQGEILLEVATDKVNNEIVAPASGTLVKKLVLEDEVISVKIPVALIQFEETTLRGTKDKKAEKPKTATAPTPSKRTPLPSHTDVSNTYTTRENIFISPLIDQIARVHHISYEELARIPASGTDGRLRKSDVFAYLDAGRPAKFAQPVAAQGFRIPDLKFDKGNGRIVEMDRMRQMIADHMVYSKHVSPHVTAYVEADLTEMAQWRNQVKADFEKKHGIRLTFTPLFISAVVRAILDFPNINSSIDGKNIIIKDEINIGMATALPTGNLIVPVVHRANEMKLPELAKKTIELAQKARENKLSGDEIKGSTFTISNVGTFGSLMGTPIINQPEAAILATGIIKKRAEVMERPDGDSIEIRSMMMLSLSFDHRIVDGYLAGSFLRRIADYMEEKPTTDDI